MNSPTNISEAIYKYNPNGYMKHPSKHPRAGEFVIGKNGEKWSCDEGTLQELENALTPKNSCVEFLSNDQLVKPYYDVDVDFETEKEMNNEKMKYYTIIKQNILEYFLKYHNDYDIESKIVWAEKHGRSTNENKPYKCSWRCWIRGYKTTLQDMNKAITDMNCYSGNQKEFDKSVYNNGRKMKTIYATKEAEKKDKRELVFYPTANSYELRDSIIQYIEEDYIMMKVPEIPETKPKPKPQKFEKYNNNEWTTLDGNAKVIGDLLEIMDYKHIAAFPSWSQIAMATFNCLCEMEIKNADLETIELLTKQNERLGIVDDKIHTYVKPLKNPPPEQSPSLGTLFYYADLSNSNKTWDIKKKFFTKDQKRVVEKLIEKTGLTHSNVAQLFYLANPELYVYSNKKWYYQRECGLYKKLKDPESSMIKDIERSIKKLLLRILNVLVMGEGEKKEEIKNISKGLCKIEDVDFKIKCIKQLKAEYLDEDFDQEVDEKKHLLGFENGVFDLDEMKFRKATKKDAVCKSCLYDFEELDENDERIQKAEDFIRSCFPSKAVQNYMLRMCGSLLYGGNPDEKIYFFTGIGGNGKSAFFENLRNVFGDYHCPLDESYFTTEKNTNAANPYLLNTKGTRVVLIQEPSKSKTYMGNKLKEMTGSDRLTARALHKDPDSKQGFKVQFKMLIMGNFEITIDTDDEGMKRRISMTDFPYKFIESEDYEEAQKDGYEALFHDYPAVHDKSLFKPKNRELAKECANLEGHIWINLFLKWYKIYKTKNMEVDIPEEVKLASTRMTDKLDPFPSWFRKYYEKKESGYVKTNDILSFFNSEADVKISPKGLIAKLKTLNITAERKMVWGQKCAVIKGYMEKPTEEIGDKCNITEDD